MNLTAKTDGELIAMIEAMQQVIACTDGDAGDHTALHFHMAHAVLEQAEDELTAREQARILDEIHADREARERYEAMLAAQADDLPTLAGDEPPF